MCARNIALLLLLTALALCYTIILPGCGGSSGQPVGVKAASDYPTLTTDLIQGGGGDGNKGTDVGDVQVSYDSLGTNVTVLVTLAPGYGFKPGEKVTLYASDVKPASTDVVPGQMPIELTVSGTAASVTFPAPVPGANLYLMLHAVVGQPSAGTYTYTAALIEYAYTYIYDSNPNPNKETWVTVTGTTTATGEIWGGQNYLVGHYTVSVDDGYLTICAYMDDPAWTLEFIHFWYGDEDGVPSILNSQGKIVPGAMPFQFDPPASVVHLAQGDYPTIYGSGTTSEYCIQILASDLFPEADPLNGCKSFLGALHFNLMQDKGGGIVVGQTGWAEKPSDWNSGTLFGFEVCEYYTPGGDGQYETAWGYDNTTGAYPGGYELGFFADYDVKDGNVIIYHYEGFPWSDGKPVNKWGWVFYYPAPPADGPWPLF